MNIVNTKKHIARLYKDSYKIIKKEFTQILNIIYQEIFEDTVSRGFDGSPKRLDEKWIDEFFSQYNPVTRYVFLNELDRKKSYLFESVVASPQAKHQSYAKAERLLKNQVTQGGIDLEDAIAMSVFKTLGVTKVRWVAESDHKTCGACQELDGQIFPIGEAPEKQHHNCRCYYIPVKE